MAECHQRGNKVARRNLQLSNTYPRQELCDLEAELQSQGLKGSAVLHVALRD